MPKPNFQLTRAMWSVYCVCVFNWWEVWPKSWSIFSHVSSEINSTNLLTSCLYIWHLVFRVVRPIVYYYCFDVWPFDTRDVTFFSKKKREITMRGDETIPPCSNRINLCMFGQVRPTSRCWVAVVHAVGYFHWISSVCFQFWTNFIFNTYIKFSANPDCFCGEVMNRKMKNVMHLIFIRMSKVLVSFNLIEWQTFTFR